MRSETGPWFGIPIVDVPSQADADAESKYSFFAVSGP